MSRLLAAALTSLVSLGCGSAQPARPEQPVAPPAPTTHALAAPSASSPPAAATSAAPVASAAQAEAPEVVPEPQRLEIPGEIEAIIDAPDRLSDDKALDVGRQPGMTLVFYSITPGMNVAELGAGSGYFTEVLARAVGPKGKVFAENGKAVTDKPIGKAWADRLKRPALANVVRVDRELESPLPPEATNLDAVFAELFYHDLYWMNVDRVAMNKAIFRALKPGGVYALIDHASKRGEGTAVVKTLHRIEEAEVVRDVQAAGFVLDGEATFLRNPRDTKDWSTLPAPNAEKRGTSDRFVLRFKKPT